MLRRIVLLLGLTLTPAAGAAEGAVRVVFEDNFERADRLVQNPPASLAWHASNPGAVALRGANLRLFLRRDGEARVVAHFPRVELAPGEHLALAFRFDIAVAPADVADAFVFGLYESDGKPENRFSADNREPAGKFRGLDAALSFSDQGARLDLSLARFADADRLPRAGARAGKPFFHTRSPSPLRPGRAYQAELRLVAEAPGKVRAELELSGGDLDKGAIHRAALPSAPKGFDTVAFSIARPGVSDLYLSAISLTHEPALDALR